MPTAVSPLAVNTELSGPYVRVYSGDLAALFGDLQERRPADSLRELLTTHGQLLEGSRLRLDVSAESTYGEGHSPHQFVGATRRATYSSLWDSKNKRENDWRLANDTRSNATDYLRVHLSLAQLGETGFEDVPFLTARQGVRELHLVQRVELAMTGWHDGGFLTDRKSVV